MMPVMIRYCCLLLVVPQLLDNFGDSSLRITDYVITIILLPFRHGRVFSRLCIATAHSSLCVSTLKSKLFHATVFNVVRIALLASHFTKSIFDIDAII